MWPTMKCYSVYRHFFVAFSFKLICKQIAWKCHVLHTFCSVSVARKLPYLYCTNVNFAMLLLLCIPLPQLLVCPAALLQNHIFVNYEYEENTCHNGNFHVETKLHFISSSRIHFLHCHQILLLLQCLLRVAIWLWSFRIWQQYICCLKESRIFSRVWVLCTQDTKENEWNV